MRFFVYIFIVFDVLVVLAGLFFIFEKTFRKIKVEHHYTFCPIKKDGMKGWALINDENKILCYSVKEGEEKGNAVYRYKNRVTKLFSTHRVSQMLRNNKAPNFSRKSVIENLAIQDGIFACLSSNSRSLSSSWTFADAIAIIFLARTEHVYRLLLISFPWIATSFSGNFFSGFCIFFGPRNFLARARAIIILNILNIGPSGNSHQHGFQRSNDNN